MLTLREGYFELSCFQNDKLVVIFEFSDNLGNPLDLGDWQLIFVARNDEDNVEIEQELVVEDAANGRAILHLPPHRTSKDGVYRCEIRAVNGEDKFTLGYGHLLIKAVIR